MNVYTENFYCLSAQNNLHEIEQQLVARYTGGLKESIQNKLQLNAIWSLSQVVNLAFKVQLQVNIAHKPPFFRKGFTDVNTKENNGSPYNKPYQGQSSSQLLNKSITGDVKGISNSHQKLIPPRDNQYQRAGPSKCLCCFQTRHQSNECPTRKQVHVMEGEHTDNDEEEPTVLTEGHVDVHGDEREFVSCILEKVLLAPCLNNQTQRHSILRTRCTVNHKVCDLLIDSKSTENVQ